MLSDVFVFPEGSSGILAVITSQNRVNSGNWQYHLGVGSYCLLWLHRQRMCGGSPGKAGIMDSGTSFEIFPYLSPHSRPSHRRRRPACPMKTAFLPTLGLLVLAATASAAPVFTQTDVFVSGQDGYSSYRIPAIETTPDGTLIAFAEGRRDNMGDPGAGDINLVYKTSADGGATWSDLMILDDPGEDWAVSNPTSVVDSSTGATWVLYNRWEPGFGTVASQPGTDNCQAWARVSLDNGATWSDGIDITTQSRDYNAWGAIFFGPGGGIQAQDGRLLIPSSYKPGRDDRPVEHAALCGLQRRPRRDVAKGRGIRRQRQRKSVGGTGGRIDHGRCAAVERRFEPAQRH